jgi:formylmethanofuran dehydrogenase subunit B
MAYREENGQVVLTMSRSDFEVLLVALGYTLDSGLWVNRDAALAYVNRLNQGNPNYTPYEVAEKS